MRARTMASISDGVRSWGSVVFETIRQWRASAGKSHSKVTPTTSAPAPRAKRISVAEGGRETMRTLPHASNQSAQRALPAEDLRYAPVGDAPFLVGRGLADITGEAA